MAVELHIYVTLLISLIAALANLTVQMRSTPVLILERQIPSPFNKETNLSDVRVKDMMRHERSLSGISNFTLRASYDPSIACLYYAKLWLGNPQKDYYVQIDTGSVTTWVSCVSCTTCPPQTHLEVPLNFFNPKQSATASEISCSHRQCDQLSHDSEISCSNDSRCSYKIQYADKSGTHGHFVSDVILLDVISSVNTSISAPIVFCTERKGLLKDYPHAADGIVGLGRDDISLAYQLASQGVTSRGFSHCLRGDNGGVLAFGDVVTPNMVYSPLVPETMYYALMVEGISINGHALAIDSKIFSSRNGQTIFDSGTALAFLAEGVYEPFFSFIDKVVANQTILITNADFHCYISTSRSASIESIFPEIRFNFKGDAALILKPKDYLIPQSKLYDVEGGWCIGISKNEGSHLTIIGDILLKDKIIVYDNVNERLGWADYDCSQPLKMSQFVKKTKSKASVVRPMSFLTHFLALWSFLPITF